MVKHQTHIVVEMLVCYLQQLSFFFRGPRCIIGGWGAVVVPMDAVGRARSAIDRTDPVLPKLVAPGLDCLIDAYTAKPVHSACCVMPSHCQITEFDNHFRLRERSGVSSQTCSDQFDGTSAVAITGISRRR